jgi:hypothetical protein
MGGVIVRVISNKTRKPIKVPLPGGKFLHLGPLKTAEISDQAVEHAALQKLVKAGDIEILGVGEHASGGPDAAGSPQESRQGHPPNTLYRPKGNR